MCPSRVGMVFCIELKRVEVTLSGAIEKSRGEVDEGRWNFIQRVG